MWASWILHSLIVNPGLHVPVLTELKLKGRLPVCILVLGVEEKLDDVELPKPLDHLPVVGPSGLAYVVEQLLVEVVEPPGDVLTC